MFNKTWWFLHITRYFNEKTNCFLPEKFNEKLGNGNKLFSSRYKADKNRYFSFGGYINLISNTSKDQEQFNFYLQTNNNDFNKQFGQYKSYFWL